MQDFHGSPGTKLVLTEYYRKGNCHFNSHRKSNNQLSHCWSSVARVCKFSSARINVIIKNNHFIVRKMECGISIFNRDSKELAWQLQSIIFVQARSKIAVHILFHLRRILSHLWYWLSWHIEFSMSTILSQQSPLIISTTTSSPSPLPWSFS